MSTLADAVLSAPERRALERFARELERELGDELRGVWLYGSRARGERTGPESDVDLLVITDRARERDRLSEMLDQAAEAEGADRLSFSIQLYDLDWLADRRGTEAFFVKGVDRDRIVLAGDPEGLRGASAGRDAAADEGVARGGRRALGRRKALGRRRDRYGGGQPRLLRGPRRCARRAE